MMASVSRAGMVRRRADPADDESAAQAATAHNIEHNFIPHAQRSRNERGALEKNNLRGSVR